MYNRASSHGFTLFELVISMALGATLVTGITQLTLAVGASYRLQQNLGAVQENARFAFETIGREIEGAGFVNEPWLSDAKPGAIGDRSVDAFTSSGDRVSVKRLTDQNCFENRNTALDENGAAAFYLRESTFSINSGDSLALTCRYGPDASGMITQINNLGLVEDAAAFQVLYGEDSDNDDDADRWVPAGSWLDETNIRSVRLGLLLASPDTLVKSPEASEYILGERVNIPADGRLYRVFETTFAIQGRAW
jgi:type IV pilus assembly protein PilW